MQKTMNILLMTFLSLTLMIRVNAETFTHINTHDALNRLIESNINDEQAIKYHYHGNGRIDYILIEGKDFIQMGESPSLNIWSETQSGSISVLFTFTADTNDKETPKADLLVRWDFDNDDKWDTPFNSSKQVDYQFILAGKKTIKAEVKDTDGNTTQNSMVFNVCDNESNQPPQAIIKSSVADKVILGTYISFSALDSFDPDGKIVRYEWDFGDGSSISIHNSPSHLYLNKGTYNVQLTVKDDNCGVSKVTKTISVIESTIPQSPLISIDKDYFSINQGQHLSIPLGIIDPDSSHFNVTSDGATGGYIKCFGGQYSFEWCPSGDISGTFEVNIQVVDSIELLATKNITIKVNPVSNPAINQWRFIKMSELNFNYNLNHLDIDANYVYISGGKINGIVPINVSNTSAPVIHPSIDTPGNSYYIDVEGSYIYVADYNDGIGIYTKESSPSKINNYVPHQSGQLLFVTATGSIVFGKNLDGTLYVIDASTPSSPILYNSIEGVGGVRMDTWSGLGYLYVETSTGIKIIDYRTPSSATVYGTVIPGNIRRIFVQKSTNRLYVARNYVELEVYDITNRISPKLIASETMDGYVKDFTVDESDRIIVFCDTSIYLMEINGNTFKKLSQYVIDYEIFSMTVQNSNIYVTGSNKFCIYQYQNADNHTPIAYNQSITLTEIPTRPVSIKLDGFDQDGNTLQYIVDSESTIFSGNAPNMEFQASTFGTYYFEFKVTDGFTDSPPATVVVSLIDECNAKTYYYDGNDYDGFGDPKQSIRACSQPTDFVDNNTDQCPGDSEKKLPGHCGCGESDTNYRLWYYDGDLDTFGDPDSNKQACTKPQDYVADNSDLCPGDKNKKSPGNCGCGENEKNYQLWYYDGDHDTYGDPNNTRQACSQPQDYVTDQSDLCPDEASKKEPGYCGCHLSDTHYKIWYFDEDKDTYGNPNIWKQECFQPENYVDNNLDQCPTVYGKDTNYCGKCGPDDMCCPQWDYVKDHHQIINYLDLGAFADHWLETEDHENWDSRFNLSPVLDPNTGKQVINYLDLGVFADHWLESSPCSE